MELSGFSSIGGGAGPAVGADTGGEHHVPAAPVAFLSGGEFGNQALVGVEGVFSTGTG